jgi:putative component of toxin-antitoxin plasmid stabilization module
MRKMTNKQIKIILTKTYLDSLDKLRDPSIRVAIEKKVNKLLESPDIAQPMCYQHEGFCEIPIGSKYRVYCIRFDGEIIVFVLGPAMNHKNNYHKTKEYKKLFEQLRQVKEEFKNKF